MLGVEVLVVVGRAFFYRVGILFSVGATRFLGVEVLMVVGRAFF